MCTEIDRSGAAGTPEDYAFIRAILQDVVVDHMFKVGRANWLNIRTLSWHGVGFKFYNLLSQCTCDGYFVPRAELWFYPKEMPRKNHITQLPNPVKLLHQSNMRSKWDWELRGSDPVKLPQDFSSYLRWQQLSRSVRFYWVDVVCWFSHLTDYNDSQWQPINGT